VPLKYDGKPVSLTPEQEEIASFYAAIPLDGPQLGKIYINFIFEP
jgi:DNA topoisomerase-1